MADLVRVRGRGRGRGRGPLREGHLDGRPGQL